ncbi:MAG: AsmA-like C-terminal domain-containing protein [Phycisphaerae bacterium]|nr:AsmA-like C-terminal domain-containing protein [Phycisphaerae bacterium]
MPQTSYRPSRLEHWRRFFASTTFLRHPVSVARERIGAATLALLLTGFGIYLLTTRDAAIRQRAIDFIRKSTPGGLEISVGSASFGMFDGITLHDVQLAVPSDDRLDPTAKDFSSRLIFSSPALKLVHNPWLLILGKLRVEQVTAVEPTIYLRHNVDTGLRNWQLLTAEKKNVGDRRQTYRPIITLRSARAVVVGIDSTGTRETREERLDADVRPHPQAETGYYIEVRRYSEPVERTTVYFDPGERMVANTPFVDARTIRLQLPKTARDLFDRIALRGEVRLSRLLYDSLSQENRDTEIVLRRVQCDIPLAILESEKPKEPADAGSPPTSDESLVHMNDVRGSITIIGDRFHMNIAGQVNNAPCRVHGELWNTTADEFKDFGVNVTVEARDLPVPEGKARNRLLAENARTPGALRNFLEDYGPHGKLNAYLKFTRRANQAGTMRTDGYVIPLGMRGSAKWFKYPLDEVRGTIHFAGTHVRIENLHGRHGCGSANINALIDVHTYYPDVDLDIQATSIPLDAKLFEALPDRYKSVLQRFRPRGMAHVRTRLQRPGVLQDQPKPKWTQLFTIDLVDVSASVQPHPYVLENIHGRLEVDGDRIQINRVSGDSNGASMEFDGYAIVPADGDPEMEVRVEATGIRMDAEYVASMPSKIAAELSQFRPVGVVDLVGIVSTHKSGGDMQWDLSAQLQDATIQYAQFPYLLEHAAGELEIDNDGVRILELNASHGAAAIQASGDVRRSTQGGRVVDLDFNARGVLLDETLHESLPTGLKDIWAMLNPHGKVRIRTHIRTETDELNSRLLHRTEIELIDAAILFRPFPLPLTAVNGKLMVINDRVEIVQLSARSQDATIQIRGDFQFGASGLQGVLRIEAQDLSFDETLVSALPTALQEFVRATQATGRFNLSLLPLQFTTDEEGRLEWRFSGAMTMAATNAKIGLKLESFNGCITGQGFVAGDGSVDLDARVSAQTVKMAGWLVNGLEARLRTSEDRRVITIDEARAKMYGGDAVGSVEIELGKRRAEYRASITARDMQLDQYIMIHHPPRSPTATPANADIAKGSVTGNLILSGMTGRNGYNEGSGEFYIREAQVWKLPLILAIFQVLNLTPDENVFHDGLLKFYLSEDRVTFQKIDLQGKAMSFIGSGTLDLGSNQIDLVLLAGSPVRIKVPLLSDLLEGAAREIMEVRVTGTLAEPIITPQPLKSLTKALKTVFPDAPPPRKRESPN